MNRENTMQKRNLKFYLHIYFMILSQDIKSKLSYRADFFISTIGMMFTNALGFLTFYVIFQNFPSIMGWNYYEMIFLYAFSLIAMTPNQCLFDNNWNLRHHVYSGDFIKYYFRPINIFFYYISEVFDLKGLGQLVFGITAMVYAWTKLALPISFLIIVKLIIALISASLFMIGIMNLAAASCFYFINSGFLLVTAQRIIECAKYPVTVFSRGFRFFFTFLIPLAFIAYYPSLLFVKPERASILSWLTPVFGVAFFYLSYKVWVLGANHYNGTGS